ncbi:DNA-binding protein H-NS [Vibrio stylophorae]|uniref:DNA-binding protein n=1 Tax=Vibrio stylophorae TaxID=659351 RepID=A0ABM8ZRP5_9VIBR|nr:H-NS family nucleoid-associated regulatory protein [Vibrio stylophorae]CAH0532963.1 DNA-binding protein H-NS [Vibrio stylophorae]
MSEAIKVLLNLRSLRAQTRDLSLEQLVEAQEKLTLVIAEREESEAAEREANAERLAKLEQYREMLLKDGINPEELFSESAPKAKGKRAPRPAKYKFIDENGEEKTWTGQGRTPSALKEKLDAGANLDDFLI